MKGCFWTQNSVLSCFSRFCFMTSALLPKHASCEDFRRKKACFKSKTMLRHAFLEYVFTSMRLALPPNMHPMRRCKRPFCGGKTMFNHAFLEHVLTSMRLVLVPKMHSTRNAEDERLFLELESILRETCCSKCSIRFALLPKSHPVRVRVFWNCSSQLPFPAIVLTPRVQPKHAS